MNEIILTNDNGEQCITSMQIAEATGKWQDAQGCDESHPKHGASLVEG